MAGYIDANDLRIPIEEAFTDSAERDPGVEESHRQTNGEAHVDSRFNVAVSFLVERSPLEYDIDARSSREGKGRSSPSSGTHHRAVHKSKSNQKRIGVAT